MTEISEKAKCVAVITAATNEYEEKDLNKKTVKSLYKIMKDLDLSIDDYEDPNEVEPEPEDTSEPEPEAEPENEEEEVDHVPFCGVCFDPNNKSDCFLVCKKDNPEEFALCLKDYEKPKKVKVKEKKVRTASSGEKTRWGRRVGTQAALIEECLDAKKPMTNKEIAEFANCSVSRVRRHWLRLTHKENKVPVLITKDGKIFIKEVHPELKGELAYPRGKASQAV